MMPRPHPASNDAFAQPPHPSEALYQQMRDKAVKRQPVKLPDVKESAR